MATGSNTFEGIASGVAPSSANSGGASGDAISSIAVAAGDSILVQSSAADHGSRGVEMSLIAGGAGATRVLWACASTTRQVISFYYKIDSVPAAVEDVAGLRHASGNMGILVIASDGKLQMFDSAGSGISGSKSPSAIPANTWIRIDMSVVNGTTTSNGTLGYSYYIGESSIAQYSWESSAVNATTNAQSHFFIGRSTGRTAAHTVQYDTIRWQSLSSGWMAPFSPSSGTGVINTAEGGTADTVPTTGNTGGASGDAATVVNVGSGNTLLFSDFIPAHGSMGYGFTYGTTAGGNLQWDIADSGRVVFSFYMSIETLPTAVEYLGSIRNSSGNMCIACIGADGKFIMQNTAGAGISASRATNTFPIDQNVRVEIAVRKGTGTGDGLIEYAYYLGDSSTAEFTWSSSAQNTGTTDVARVLMGRNTAAAETRTVWYDTMRAQALSSGWLGPYQDINMAPTANLGGNVTNIEPYSTQTINGSNSKDNDTGTIASYTFRQISGSPTVTINGTGAIRTYTAPGTVAGTTLVFGLVVTDNQGADSTEDTVTHTILPVTERAVIGGVEVPMQISSVNS